MKKVDAILCADIHLRDDQPECWQTSYWKAQAKAVKFLRQLKKEHDCPIVIAGDVFHHWKASPYLLGWAIKRLPKIYAICGQHDLPSHQEELFHKSALYVLEQAKRVKVCGTACSLVVGDSHELYGYIYGSELKGLGRESDNRRIALCHTMVYKGKEPFPGASEMGGTAGSLLKKMKGFDLVVTGDNHEPFTFKKNGRLLVNPGSMMRMTAKQIDFKPRVYLWCAETNEVEPAYFPIKKNDISRDHIDAVKNRDGRIDAFVSRLSESADVGLSFKENMKKFLKENKIKKEVEEIIWESCDE